MNSSTMTYNLKAIADVKDVISNIESIQKVLNQLKVPDALKDNFNKIFSSLEKNGTKAVSAFESGFKTKGAVTDYTNALTQINNLLGQLQKNMSKVSSSDLENSIHIDAAQLKEAQEAVKNFQEQLKAKVNSQPYDELISKVKSLKTQYNSSSKSFEEFEKALRAGNFEEASRRLQNIANGFGRIKDETKRGQAIESITQLSKALDGLRNDQDVVNILKELDQAQFNLSNLNTQELEKVERIYQNLISSLGQMARETEQVGNSTTQAAIAQYNFNSELDQLKTKVGYFFGLNNAIQLFQRAITAAYQTVKDLDKVMTETAVVTDFSVGDMWKQLPQYTKQANELGVSIHSAYEAATLYYQQGLKTNEVVALSNETLKMARIAGLGASEATDRMTNALRGFNMELNQTNAQNVADVYSKLAAITASNVDEISTAMTKVASLANNANMSFENTAAFLSQIIETTRESAETAGTALKTIIARFSEVKKLYSEGELLGVDAEGEAIDVNKISSALRIAGINLNEFLTGSKSLDQIFIELMAKWDSLTTIQQRYIATMGAGSRQQSRFIAMLSDYKRTMELTEAANNAAGASQQQYEKTLESLESKLNQLKNAWDSFIMSIANNEAIKFAVDLLTGLLTGINNLTDALPGALSGISKIGLVFMGLKLGKPVVEKALGSFSSLFVNKTGEIGEKGGETLFKSFVESFKKSRTNNKGVLKSTQEAMGELFASNIDFKLTSEELESVQEQIQKLGTDAGKSKQEIDELINSIGNDRRQAAIVLKELNGDTTELDANLENATKSAAKFGQKLTTASAAAAVIGSSLLLISQAVRSKGNEKAADIIQAIGVGLTTVSVLLPIVGKLGIKAGTELAAGGAIASAGWAWIAGIGLLVAGAVAGITYLIQTYESAEDKAARLEKQTREANQAALEAQEEYNGLLSSQSEYAALIEQVESLTEGTTKWKEAIAKVNEETLKLLSMYDILAGYATFDEKGMYTISEAGWNALLEQQQNKIRANQYQVLGSRMERTSNRVEEIRRSLGSETISVLGAGYIENFFVKDLEEAQSKYSELLNKSGRTDQEEYFVRQYERYQEEIEGYLNNAFSSSAIETVLAQRFDSLKSAETIADTLTKTMSLGADLISKEVEELTSEELKEAYKKETGIDINTLDESERPTEAEQRAVLEGAKLTNKIVDKIENILKDAEKNPALAALLGGDLDVQGDYREQPSNPAFWQDLLTRQAQQRFNLNTEFADRFGKDISGLGITYNVANELATKFKEIEKSIPNIVIDFKALVDESERYSGEDGLQKLASDLSAIDFNDPINGAQQLKNMIAALGEDGAASIFQEILDNPFFSDTSQINTVFNNLKSNLEDLRKSGKITGQNIRELAKDNKDLATVLKNTGFSVYTLADYFDRLITGEIDAAEKGTDFVKVLNQIRTTANAEQGAFEFLKNADWRNTDSATDIHKGLQEMREAFEELYDLGAYDDKKMQEILTVFFDDKWMKEPIASIKILKNLFDNATESAYGFWTTYISGSTNLDAISFSEDGKSLEIFIEKLSSTEQLIKDVMDKMGVSRTFAELMFADLINMSDGAREAFERLDIQASDLKSAFDTKQIGKYIGVTKKELESVARIYGISASQIQQAFENTFGDGFFITDEFETATQASEKIKAGIIAGIQEGVEQGKEFVIDLTAAKNWLVDLGMNPEEAQKTINTLVEEVRTKFGNIDLEITDESIQYFNITVNDLASYLQESWNKAIEDGTRSGTIEAKDIAQSFIDDVGSELGDKIAKALKEGSGQGFNEDKKVFDLYTDYVQRKEKWLAVQNAANEREAHLELLQAQRTSLLSYLSSILKGSDVLEYDRTIEHMQKQLRQLDEDISLDKSVYEKLSKSIQERWEEADLARAIYESALQQANEVLPPSSSDDFPPNEQKDKWQILLEKLEELKRQMGYGTDKLTAYTTETARALAGDGKGETKPEKTTYYDSPYTELDNINEALSEQLRQRTKLERKYNEVLKLQTSTIEEVRDAYQAQIKNLERQSEIQEKRAMEASRQLYDLGNKRYFDSQGNPTTFEKMGVTQYAVYNRLTGEVEIDWESLDKILDKEIGDAVEKYIGYLRQLSQEFEEATDAVEEIKETIEDIQRQAIETYMSFEERVLDAVTGRREREIDTLEKSFNALNKSASKLLSALQEQINADRQARQNADTEQMISDKEARLAYLRRDTSGANQLEILQLEKELEEDRQNYSDSLIDQALNQLQTDADYAAEQRDSIITIMRDQLASAIANGELWDEVHQLINDAIGPDGSFREDSELLVLLREQENFNAMSLTAQKVYMDDLVASFKDAMAGAGQADMKYGAGTSGINYPGLTGESGNTTGAGAAGGKTEDNNKLHFSTQQLKELAVTIGSGAGGWGTGATLMSQLNELLDPNAAKEAYNYAMRFISDVANYGLGEALTDWAYSEGLGYNWKVAINEFRNRSGPGVDNEELLRAEYSNYDYFNLKRRLSRYKNGGLVDYTGPAWLDGSNSNPEMVLSATDTKNFMALRDILAQLAANGLGGGDAYYDIDINAEINSDYDVDQLAARIKKQITENASYRNVNTINFIR